MKQRKPSLLSLKAFEAVARHGSFKSAADELFVTSGALSQQVRKLESEMGFEVFDRKHQKITLTGKGKELSDTLAEAFVCIDQKIDSLRLSNQKRPVRVSCGPPVAAKWLAPRLHKLPDLNPSLTIEIVSEKDLVSYQSQDIDIGIRLSRDEDPSLERTWLFEESAVAVCSPDYAAKHNLTNPQDIARTTLLKDDGLNYCRGPIWERWCELAGVDKSLINNSIHFYYSPEQAIDAAIAGTGVMIAASALVSLDLECGRLVVPFGPEVKTHVKYQIVTPKMKLKRAEVQAFQSWVTNELRAYNCQEKAYVVNT